MSTLEQRGLVRLRYRRRQLLAGDDLRREVSDQTELQWWHNRAVHDAHGLVTGLGTSFSEDGGTMYVVVEPGLGYDAYGRGLELRRPVAIPLPTDDPGRLSGFVLLLRSPADDPWARRTPGRPRTPAAPPALCWAGPGTGSTRDGVPLGCLTVERLPAGHAKPAGLPPRIAERPSGDALLSIGRVSAIEVQQALDNAGDDAYRDAIRSLYTRSQGCPWPRRARRIARSRVASGSTIPGRTAWQPWTITAIVPSTNLVETAVPVQIGFRVRIDTTAAGFTETPVYSAWLQGPLFGRPANGPPTGGVHWDHVDLAGPGGFTFFMALMTSVAFEHADTDRDPADRPWAATMNDLLKQLRDEPFAVSWVALPATDPRCSTDDDLHDDPEDPCVDEVSDGHVH